MTTRFSSEAESLAGGLGAGFRPQREREGQSPLASLSARARGQSLLADPLVGARGAQPTRKKHLQKKLAQPEGDCRHNQQRQQQPVDGEDAEAGTLEVA
jgi:hypothetical protein